jgi:hypothetical protein
MARTVDVVASRDVLTIRHQCADRRAAECVARELVQHGFSVVLIGGALFEPERPAEGYGGS